MRWVKEIFPPLVRLRWLLITIRLSAISLAGTARTLVAVGTLSEASMFFAIAAAAPRSCLLSDCCAFGAGAAALAAGAGLVSVGFAAGFGAGSGAVLTWPFVVFAGSSRGAGFAVTSGVPWFCVGLKSEKKSCHAASTEFGSARNWSYISSTSHSLGPNCDAGLLLDTAGTRLYPSRSWLSA